MTTQKYLTAYHYISIMSIQIGTYLIPVDMREHFKSQLTSTNYSKHVPKK